MCQPYLSNIQDAGIYRKIGKLISISIRISKPILYVQCAHLRSKDYVELAFFFERDYPTIQFVPNMFHPKSNSDETLHSMRTLQHFGNGKHLRPFLSWISYSTPWPHRLVRSEIPVGEKTKSLSRDNLKIIEIIVSLTILLWYEESRSSGK